MVGRGRAADKGENGLERVKRTCADVTENDAKRGEPEGGEAAPRKRSRMAWKPNRHTTKPGWTGQPA